MKDDQELGEGEGQKESKVEGKVAYKGKEGVGVGGWNLVSSYTPMIFKNVMSINMT